MRSIFKKSFLGLMLGVIGLSVLNSCGSRKEMVYLQPDSTALHTKFEQFVPRIQPSDILTIVVTASDPKVLTPFSPLSTMPVGNMTQQTDLALRPTYTVDNEGNINFPILGKVRLGGLTRLEATEVLRKRLESYIQDPLININYSNFRISVLGEVLRPGSFVLPTERATVLEALGMAGDMTIRGVRNNVLLIREVDGQKQMHRLDLTKQDVLNSPYYYLAQNDVIYVEMNQAQMNNSKLGANSSIIVSVAGLLITVISVLTRK